jgi:hypothetical protein
MQSAGLQETYDLLLVQYVDLLWGLMLKQKDTGAALVQIPLGEWLFAFSVSY